AVGAGFLVLPLAGLQAALDVDRTALLQVFARDLGQAVVEHHAVPFGFFAALARGLVLPLGRGGDGDVADRRTIGAVTDFGVTPQVADENDFVDGGHGAGSCSERCGCHYRGLASPRAHRNASNDHYRPRGISPTSRREGAVPAPAVRLHVGPRTRGPDQRGSLNPRAVYSQTAASTAPAQNTMAAPPVRARTPPSTPPANTPRDWAVL